MAFNPATLDTRAASEEGVWFTIEDVDGKEIYDDGEPVQLRLVGRDSAVAKEAMRSLSESDNTAKEVAKLIKGWSSNLDVETAEQIASIPHLTDWIARKVLDRANFMTAPSKK